MRLPTATVRAAALTGSIAVLALAGCGGGEDGSDSGPGASGTGVDRGGSAVEISDYAFHPGAISVPSGTTIVFSNEDETAHTATAEGSEVFDTGAIEPGKNAEVTLEQPGTYDYYCAFHPFMKGKIEVE